MRLVGSGGRGMVSRVGRCEECWLCGAGVYEFMIYDIQIREQGFERIGECWI